MRPTVKVQDEAFRTIGKGFATCHPASDNATAFILNQRFAGVTAREHPGWLWRRRKTKYLQNTLRQGPTIDLMLVGIRGLV